MYIVGAPGSGKSTLMDAIVEKMGFSWGPVERLRRELDVNQLLDGWGQPKGLVWGVHRDGGYAGTDALSMSVLPQARTYIRENDPPEYVFGEGIRLSSPKFLVELDRWAPLTVVALTAPADLLAQRRAEREARGAKPLRPAQVKSATTQASNVAETMAALGYPVLCFNTGVCAYSMIVRNVLREMG